MQDLDISCQECTEVQKNWRGCKTEVEANEFSFEDISLKRCPVKLIQKNTIEYIHFYNLFDKGFLPNSGSLLDQPSKFLEVITTIQGFISRKDREKEKERKQKASSLR